MNEIKVGLILFTLIVNTLFAVDVDEGRLNALGALFDMMSPAELTTKVDILSKSKDVEKKGVAAYLLGEYYEILIPKQRIIVLKRLLEDSSTDVRACGLIACDNNLSRIVYEAGDEIIPIIEKLRNDPSPATRRWANREGDEIKRLLKVKQSDKSK